MGDKQNDVVVSLEDFLSTKFDYLVLGGGTAGLVVAGRLAEDPNVKVGVLEAGKDRRGDPVVDMPLGFPQAFENPEYDWMHYTSPQKYNQGKKHHVVRGKLLGGSSAINAQMYVRGSESDYDSWARVVGDEGWNAKSMMKYMRKHETLEDMPAVAKDDSTYLYRTEFHGKDGPIRTSFNESKMPIEDAFVNACNESMAVKAPADAWSGDHVGFTTGLGAISREGAKHGKRSYSINYLEGKSSKNLKILCEALVNRVNLDGATAVGANFTHNSKVYDISASKEIIISGGTINTPQILELSGVGDPEVLKAAGVKVLVENKGVGANMQDHAATSVCVDIQSGIFSMDLYNQKPEMAQAAVVEYMTSQTGFFSNVFGPTGFIPFKTLVTPEEFEDTIASIKKIQPSSDFHAKQLTEIIKEMEDDKSANIQVAFFPLTWAAHLSAEHQGNRPGKARTQGAGVSFVICTEYVVSRGTCHIVSSDPSVGPAINPNYGEAYADKMVLAAVMRWADRVRRSGYLGDYLDGKRTYPDESEDLEDLQVGVKMVEKDIISEYHICGSVAMGDALDSRLRVKGVTNLRVADASAFPGNVSGNIASTVYALAEKAADLIKEDNA